VTPRNFPPAPGWSPDGHWIKVPLNYDWGPEKLWVYAALCVRDGQALTQTARSRNTASYLELLQTVDRTYPTWDMYLIADNLANHTSGPIREWLEAHSRIQHAFISVGAAWLNLIEGRWRIFRRKAFAGQSLVDDHDIAYVTRVTTERLNRHAKPWVWGRLPKPHRVLRSGAVLCTAY
jgi:DDE superfamily endonuclease